MKLYAVNTTEPDPTKWHAWDDVHLVLAENEEEAWLMTYRYAPYKPEEGCNVVEVSTDKKCEVMRMEEYYED